MRKLFYEKLSSLIIIFFVLFVVASCDDEDDINNGAGAENTLVEYDQLTTELGTLNDLDFSDDGSESREQSDDGTITISGKTNEDECLIVTSETAEDGSLILIYDFGEACEFSGLMLSGIVSVTFGNSSEASITTTTYQDFMIDEVVYNGTDVSTSTFESTDDSDTFSFTSQTDLVRDLTVILCDGESYEVESESTTISDREGITISLLNETVSGAGVTYETVLQEALYFDFDCSEEVDTYVSGILNISAGQETRIIDYGDGMCDNLVLVTENGETSEVEASELVPEDDACAEAEDESA